MSLIMISNILVSACQRPHEIHQILEVQVASSKQTMSRQHIWQQSNEFVTICQLAKGKNVEIIFIYSFEFFLSLLRQLEHLHYHHCCYTLSKFRGSFAGFFALFSKGFAIVFEANFLIDGELLIPCSHVILHRQLLIGMLLKGALPTVSWVADRRVWRLFVLVHIILVLRLLEVKILFVQLVWSDHFDTVLECYISTRILLSNTTLNSPELLYDFGSHTDYSHSGWFELPIVCFTGTSFFGRVSQLIGLRLNTPWTVRRLLDEGFLHLN